MITLFSWSCSEIVTRSMKSAITSSSAPNTGTRSSSGKSRPPAATASPKPASPTDGSSRNSKSCPTTSTCSSPRHHRLLRQKSHAPSKASAPSRSSPPTPSSKEENSGEAASGPHQPTSARSDTYPRTPSDDTSKRRRNADRRFLPAHKRRGILAIKS